MDRNEEVEQHLSVLLSSVAGQLDAASQHIASFLDGRGEFERIAQRFAKEVEGTRQQLKQYNTPLANQVQQ